MSVPSLRTEVSEWLVEDFKAIEFVSARLPQLTLLAGANSSGKSSLLQSLLLLAQSDDEDIVLNGPLVRLGGPSDVLRDGCDHFALGAVLRASLDEQDRNNRSDVSFRLEIADDGGELRVREVLVHVDDELVLEARRGRGPTLQPSDVSASRLALSTLRVRKLNGKRPKTETYLGLAGLSPEALIYRERRRDATKQLRLDLAHSELVVRRSAKGRLHRELSAQASSLSSSLQDALALAPDREWSDEQVSELLAAYEGLTEADDFVPLQIARLGFMPSSAVRGLYAPSTAGSVGNVLRALSVVGGGLRTLRTSLRYLGPLRAEPVVVSPTGGSSRALPVGARGEFTADLLTRDRKRLVRFVDPAGLQLDRPLLAAVSVWAAELGLGEGVGVLEQGKLGRGLTVRLNGTDRDLTTIGVGASQALPVLALVLGARRGSLVLLEQPELHLHPAVQSRLADFLLFARPDVHLVVETHSEYLVTRLRLRAAQQRLDPNSVDLLFAEQADGRTSMRRLEISRLGDLSEWPRGFFDAQDEDARHIVSAVSERLKAAVKD